MSQKQVVDNGTQSSQTNALKPVLAAALSSLEVQLDQELVRYRRTKHGNKAPVPSRVSNYIPNGAPNFAQLPSFAGTVPSPSVKTPQEIPPQHPQEAEELFGTGVIKTEELQRVLNSESSTVTERVTSHEETQTTPSVSGSNLVKALHRTKTSEATVETEENIATEPSDYLESSEALLRSLTEEEPKSTKPSKSNNSLLSPLGIGSMLLLLVACSALGFALVSPKNLPQFGFAGSSGGNNEQKAQENQTNSTARNTSSNTQGQVQPTPIAKYPNLANEQFPEVNTPNDVVGLVPKAKPAPTPTTAQPGVQNPIENPVASTVPVQQMQPIPQTAPMPAPAAVPVVPPLPGTAPLAASTPAARPSPIPTIAAPVPKLEAEIKKSPRGLYQLFVPNQGAEAFNAARKAVPDAYVSDDGKVIYLGAFKTEREAAKQLKELEAQGIKAKTN
jgi:hypothetical protein